MARSIIFRSYASLPSIRARPAGMLSMIEVTRPDTLLDDVANVLSSGRTTRCKDRRDHNIFGMRPEMCLECRSCETLFAIFCKAFLMR